MKSTPILISWASALEVIKMSRFILVVIITFVSAGQLQAGIIYDLADDWSDVSNPNGVWSYNQSQGSAFDTNLADWDPNSSTHFVAAQSAWADAILPLNGHVPMWFKSVGATDGTFWDLDIPLGQVGMHGIESNTLRSNVTWTSPIDGEITISGGVWLMRNIGRNMDWRLLLNGIALTNERLLFSQTGTYNSGNLFGYDLGTGGVGVLTQNVSVGDVITLEIYRQNSFADFVGVDLSIATDEASVPEPSTLALLGVGLLGLAFRRKKAA